MYPWRLLLFMLMLSLMSRHNGPPLFFFPLLKAVSSFPFMHSVRKVVSVPCVDGFLFFFIAIVVVSSFSTFLEFLPITRLRNYLAVFPIFTFSWLVWVCIIVRGAWENRMTLASFLFFYWGHLDGLSWGLRAEVSTIDSRWGGLGTQYHMHVIITSICLLSAVRWVCWSRVLAFGSCSVDTRSTIFFDWPSPSKGYKIIWSCDTDKTCLVQGENTCPLAYQRHPQEPQQDSFLADFKTRPVTPQSFQYTKYWPSARWISTSCNLRYPFEDFLRAFNATLCELAAWLVITVWKLIFFFLLNNLVEIFFVLAQIVLPNLQLGRAWSQSLE